MEIKLWEHQVRNIKFMLDNPNVFNTSDPGTGKSLVVIKTIEALNIPTLILAPKSILVAVWLQEIKRFAPELQATVATALNRTEAFESNANIIITNHDAVTWLIKPENAHLITRFRDGLLVIDESTCYKNPTAKRSKAAAKIRKFFTRCTCMSGTPTPQGIIDVWHQMYLVDEGKTLGNSYYRFRANTYTPVNKGAFTEWKEKPGVSDAIGDLISGVTIRNKKEDCLDLPENLIVNRSIQLSAKHKKLYDEMRKQAVMELESGTVTAVNAAVLLSKLLQIASGAVYDEQGIAHIVDTDRYELVMDLVAERDHSVVVFNWRHQRDQMIAIAEKRGIKYALIDGSINDMYQRTNAVNGFQNGDFQVIFIHPQSAGHGITLTKGCATIWASPTYNSEFFVQANARIHRGGQLRKTETILISAEGTADESAYKALNNKVSNMENLLEILS
jgi:SNF2 family DNA or RNA helicase